jgi:hypothetical protein
MVALVLHHPAKYAQQQRHTECCRLCSRDTAGLKGTDGELQTDCRQVAERSSTELKGPIARMGGRQVEKDEFLKQST